MSSRKALPPFGSQEAPLYRGSQQTGYPNEYLRQGPTVQGYLVHTRPRPPRTLQWAYAQGPVVGLGGGAWYMRSTPLRCCGHGTAFPLAQIYSTTLHECSSRPRSRGSPPFIILQRASKARYPDTSRRINRRPQLNLTVVHTAERGTLTTLVREVGRSGPQLPSYFDRIASSVEESLGAGLSGHERPAIGACALTVEDSDEVY